MRVKCYIMAALVGLTATLGCSVKTDRSECPSLLYMSVYGGDEDIMYVNVIGDDYEHLMRISKRKGVGVAAFELPKNEVFNVMFSSGSPMSWDGTIDLGEQMPQLYAAHLRCCRPEIKFVFPTNFVFWFVTGKRAKIPHC